MCLALSPPSAGAFAQQQLRVARCTTAAPRSSKGVCTDVYTSAPPSGRASLVCAAVARRRRSSSLDRTTNKLETTRARGASAKRNAKVVYYVNATASALSQGVLNVGRFLQRLGLNWEVANGRFVEIDCPFLDYDDDMQGADVIVDIYVVVGGHRRQLAGAVIGGKVRVDSDFAELRMGGLKQALKDMGVVEDDRLRLTGCYSEDGRTLSVELEALETTAAALPPPALKQAHMEEKQAAAPPVALLPAPSQQLMTMQERQQAQQVRGAAADGRGEEYRVRTTNTALIEGYFNIATFLRGLGLDWEVADGRFVETGSPYFSFSENMTEAVVRATVYAVINGRRLPVECAGVEGKVRQGTRRAAFKLKGMRKVLKDMGVAEGDWLLMTGYCSEDGMLVVELEALETSAAALPAVAPAQVHANKAAAPVAPLPASSKLLRTQQERQQAQEAAVPVAAPGAEPTATAQVEAETADVPSRPGTTYITNNYYYTYHYHYYSNRGNDLEANEGHSGGW